jgi:hypothetical protein
MNSPKLDFNKQPSDNTFSLKVIVRDAFGNVRGTKEYSTDSPSGLDDWYSRNSTNELDFPTTAARRRKAALRGKKGKKRKGRGSSGNSNKPQAKAKQRSTKEKG